MESQLLNLCTIIHFFSARNKTNLQYINPIFRSCQINYNLGHCHIWRQDYISPFSRSLLMLEITLKSSCNVVDIGFFSNKMQPIMISLCAAIFLQTAKELFNGEKRGWHSWQYDKVFWHPCSVTLADIQVSKQHIFMVCTNGRNMMNALEQSVRRREEAEPRDRWCWCITLKCQRVSVFCILS